VFPTAQQGQVRAQLSLVPEGVLSQYLVPSADGSGRVMAMEIMVPTPAIRNLIRDEKIHQIYSMIQSGVRFGTQTMSQSLAELVRAGKIARAEAIGRAPQPEEVAALLADVPAAVPPAGNGYGSGLVSANR
jgi:twitching motility protein PilT